MTLIDQGGPVSDRPSEFGWIATDHAAKRQQVANVGIDFDATTYRESCWNEFMGTFYEGDTRVYGVDVDLVLLDGTRLCWRYAGSVSELITAVLASDNVVGDQGA